SAGTLTLNSNAGASAANLAIIANAAAVFGASQNLRALTVGPGVIATLTAGGGKTIKTAALFLAATAKLNLSDNDLILDYSGSSPIGTLSGSTYTGITGLIQTGRNGGTWNGNGI